ncbi:hypothetical protein SAMN04487948_11026 [Halogranum amylolyticum]|uniref:Uncharacterized protein n=1 Tax=Halogranum amylolyticum TaxID=660520 RepID=A0A1H8UA19_9EURY|nr:hypothetical protein SAMN04487948_11026 [Halogranum amylolyticum]
MVRAVNPPRTDFSNLEMSLIGYIIFLPLLVLLVPVLPFLIVLWVGEKLSSSP